MVFEKYQLAMAQDAIEWLRQQVKLLEARVKALEEAKEKAKNDSQIPG